MDHDPLRQSTPDRGPASPTILAGILSRFSPAPDMLARARKRLGMLTLVIACLGGLGLLHSLWVASSGIGAPRRGVVFIMIVVFTALSVLVHILTRIRHLSHAWVVRAGLGYELAICGVMSTMMPLFFHQNFGVLPHMTWASVFIVVFPLVVPTRPVVALGISVLAAATAPLGLALLEVSNAIPPQVFSQYIGVTVSPSFSAVLAYFGARTIHQYGTELARARRLGSYQLESRLAQGGMGEVWQARHLLLSRPAAVKIIHPQALKENDDQAVDSLMKRFELEAQTTANLRSPHTVELYDYGVSPEGHFYYVMELLDGIDLQQMVDQFGPLPARRVVHLLGQVCHSLHEAHQNGLIHRDIKPANIFVCRYGADLDFVKVVDFGLVKQTEISELTAAKAHITHKGTLLGTPAFIAPEMVLERPVDARTDVYGLGCVAYWLLTAHTVFDGRTAERAAIEHATVPAEPPSNRTEIEVPPGLEAIVMHCLQKDPADRPQSVQALGADLAALDVERWTEGDADRWWEIHQPLERRPL